MEIDATRLIKEAVEKNKRITRTATKVSTLCRQHANKWVSRMSRIIIFYSQDSRSVILEDHCNIQLVQSGSRSDIQVEGYFMSFSPRHSLDAVGWAATAVAILGVVVVVAGGFAASEDCDLEGLDSSRELACVGLLTFCYQSGNRSSAQ